MTSQEVQSLPWISTLKPVRPPYRRRLSDHSALEVWHVDIELPRWPIPLDLETKWKDEDSNVAATWRKRPLVAPVGADYPYACGEVEVALRLQRAGFQSLWISEWSGFPHVPFWADVCVKRSELKARSAHVARHDELLRERAGVLTAGLGKSGGHPDVVAWREGSDEFVFLEYKGPGDKIKPKQDLWARAILGQVTDRLPYVAVMGTFIG